MTVAAVAAGVVDAAVAAGALFVTAGLYIGAGVHPGGVAASVAVIEAGPPVLEV
jgi:hypothetical protein